MTLECRCGSGSGVGMQQRKPCSVRSVLTGSVLGGWEPESCRGQVGGWERTFREWPWGLQSLLVQSWGDRWETLPSGSLPGHQGGNRLPRGPSLAPADPTQPWKALSILQALSPQSQDPGAGQMRPSARGQESRGPGQALVVPTFCLARDVGNAHWPDG